MENKYGVFIDRNMEHFSKGFIYLCIIMSIILAQQPIALASPIYNDKSADSDGLAMKINHPEDNSDVPILVNIDGIKDGMPNEGEYLWLLINDHSSSRQWRPSGLGGGRIQLDTNNKLWEISNVVIGTDQDRGKEFDIAVFKVNSDIDQKLDDWVKLSELNPDLPGFDISQLQHSDIIARITVKRK